MSISHKSSNTQAFRLMVYNRALHPELFDVNARRTIRHGDYEVEAWVAPAGHVVRFQVAGFCLTEAVVEDGDHLPETGLVHALPCLGEKDYEMDPQDGLCYVTTVQTELLIDNLYLSTLREMREFADECDAVFHTWKDVDGSPCLSMIDLDWMRKREFHIQTYHMVGAAGFVLRTQSIFEIV